jgi:hypothetical protein
MDGQELAERVARQIRRLPQDRESLMKAIVGAFSAQELLGERLDELLDAIAYAILWRTQYTSKQEAHGYHGRTITSAVSRAVLSWERDVTDAEQERMLLGTRLHVLVSRQEDGWNAEVTEEE